MMKRTGAQIIVTLLERQGIRIVSGIPGGMNLPLYDALSHSRRLRHILVRHEQGAGFLAQGQARSSGLPAVCLATSGPGATNLVTALADAKLDSIPVIAITGQVPRSMIGTDAFQEVDMYGLSIPITKHNFLVRRAADLLRIVPEAFRIAASGRPGPVLIDVPKDVQNEVVEFSAWPKPGRPDPSLVPDPALLDQAADLIRRAHRPVLLLGGGVVHSNASAWAKSLAEKASLPCALTLMGLGSLPSTHELCLGLLGMHGSRYANQALEECDLLIVAGSRLSDRATGKVSHFCPQAKLIHLDIDESEINKIKAADLSVIGDLALSLRGLARRLAKQARRDWLHRTAELKRKHPLYAKDRHPKPAGLIRLIGQLLDPADVVVTDVGQHQMWTAQNFPHATPRCWLTSSGLGTMGFGLPSAIGAALACPDKRVVCVSGDGSLLMNIQELATTAEENVNVKIILFDNQALGLVHQQQDLFFGRRFFASHFRHAVDFVRVAQGFGIPAFTLDVRRPESALRKALNRPGPCLVRVPMNVKEKVMPMVPPGAANKDMLEGETHAEY